MTSVDTTLAVRRDGLLRFALRADALASGGLGVLALTAGGPLEDLLGTPSSLLNPVGWALVGFAVVLALVSAPRTARRWAVWMVIVVNAAWVVDSVILVFAGWYPLTGLGTAFVFAQALAVAVLAELQLVGLRRVAA